MGSMEVRSFWPSNYELKLFFPWSTKGSVTRCVQLLETAGYTRRETMSYTVETPGFVVEQNLDAVATSLGAPRRIDALIA